MAIAAGQEAPGHWERRADGRNVRVVWDPEAGRTWRVWAAGCAHVPGARAGDCLVFDAGEVVRRVWGAPPDWRGLSDAALLALTDAPPIAPPGRVLGDGLGVPRAD